jgi:hypothetical protein
VETSLITITRLQLGSNTSQDNTRLHWCCTKFEGVNNEQEAVSSSKADKF